MTSHDPTSDGSYVMPMRYHSGELLLADGVALGGHLFWSQSTSHQSRPINVSQRFKVDDDALRTDRRSAFARLT